MSEPPGALADREYQLRFVAANAWRLLAMQDREVLSPTLGSFHQAYWRDKTSEFPDSRFQEAGATLGLLCHPLLDRLRADDSLPPAEELYRGFSSALLCLSRQQYPEGCYDEWYKGERGFAVTAFTTAAYGLMAHFLGDALDDEDRRRLESTLTRSADWLVGRDDTVKVNHQAVATAALAVAWRVLGSDHYRVAARRKLEITLAHQTDEGWFPELTGLDLGYSSLLLDYLMIYHHLTGDDDVLGPMVRLTRFMLPHLHPDLTISPEGGTCRNPYLGRIGFRLLAAHDDAAASVSDQVDASGNRRAGVAAYLADDLRLARWSCLPVIHEILQRTVSPVSPPSRSMWELYPPGWTHHREAGQCAFHHGDVHVYFVAAGGGVVRCFVGERLVVEDLGIDITGPERTVTSRTLDAGRPVRLTEGRAETEVALAQSRALFPGFWSRLLLRTGSITPLSSRLLRNAIDVYRTRKKTAINQSATSVSSRGSGTTMHRSVAFAGGTLTIVDTIRSEDGELGPDTMRTHLSVNGEPVSVLRTGIAGTRLTVVKRLALEGSSASVSVDVDASGSD